MTPTSTMTSGRRWHIHQGGTAGFEVRRRGGALVPWGGGKSSVMASE